MNTEPFKLTLQGTNLYKNSLIPQRNKFVYEQVESAAIRMGQQNFTKSVMDLAVLDFKMICESRMDYYSLEEIASVLQLGALGELGDAIGMSSRTLASWVRNYQDNYRKKVARYYEDNDVVALHEPEKSKELSEQEKKDCFEEAYHDYFETGEISVFLHDLFLEWGYIPEKCQSLEKHILKAKTRLSEELSKRVQRGRIGIVDVKRVLNETLSDDGLLLQECKKMVLEEVFNWEKLRRKE